MAETQPFEQISTPPPQPPNNSAAPPARSVNPGLRDAGDGFSLYDKTLLRRELTQIEKDHNKRAQAALKALRNSKRSQLKTLSSTNAKERKKTLQNGRLEQQPTKLSHVKEGYPMFCLSPEGGVVYVKLSVSRVLNLDTGRTEGVSDGDVYIYRPLEVEVKDF